MLTELQQQWLCQTNNAKYILYNLFIVGFGSEYLLGFVTGISKSVNKYTIVQLNLMNALHISYMIEKN